MGNKMQVIESLREKLQRAKERMTERIEDKMQSLHQNSQEMLIVYAQLEEKFAELDGHKENMACFTELLQKEKEALVSVLSDMGIQKEHMEHQWKLKFTSEALHLDKLKEKKEEEKEEDPKDDAPADAEAA